MTEYLQNGALIDHMRNSNIDISTRSDIVKEFYCNEKFDNSLIILKERTSIDIQNKDFSNVLKLHY